MKTIKMYNGANYILLALSRAVETTITENEIFEISEYYNEFTEELNMNEVNYKELYITALGCFKSANMLKKVNLEKFKKQLEIVTNELSWLEVDNELYDVMFA